MVNILIVDDQACIRELLSEELISEGYRVESVGDTKTLREYLRFSQPELVLLGLYLDGCDGIGALADIKRQHRDLPVIIFTAYDSHMEDPRLSRADGYIIKRVGFWDELKQKIADVLRRKPSPQEFEVKRYFSRVSAA